jgi:hypothetical protein
VTKQQKADAKRLRKAKRGPGFSQNARETAASVNTRREWNSRRILEREVIAEHGRGARVIYKGTADE